MFFTSWIFFLAIFLTAVLLFMVVYEAILYTDLECDYINPVDCCRSANMLFYPELTLQAFIFLSTGVLCLSILSFVLQGAFLGWTLYRMRGARLSGISFMLEPTQIFSKLPELKKTTFCKIAFYLFSFFFYLYMLVSSVLAE
jgi:protein cornichon